MMHTHRHTHTHIHTHTNAPPPPSPATHPLGGKKMQFLTLRGLPQGGTYGAAAGTAGVRTADLKTDRITLIVKKHFIAHKGQI